MKSFTPGTMLVIGVAAAMAGIDWLVHRYRTKRQQPKGPVGQTGKVGLPQNMAAPCHQESMLLSIQAVFS